MKPNYQLLLEEQLKDLKKDSIPTLLLHACCGPCSSYVLEYLGNYFEITIYYYNPNIYPKEEYLRRCEECKNFYPNLKTKYPIHFKEAPYIPEDYYQKIKGYEHMKERSERCYQCYELRMEEAAKFAKENHFDYFTTTLSISPYKNADWINEIGEKLEQKYQVTYLYGDFKKKNGYKRSIELSKQYGLYRQEYCGCAYSKIQREKMQNF